MTRRATAPPPSPPHACHALHVARAPRLLCTLRVSEQCSECDARRCPNLRGPTRLWCEPEREADLAAVGSAVLRCLTLESVDTDRQRIGMRRLATTIYRSLT